MSESGPPGRRGSEVLDAIWEQVTATPQRPDTARMLFRAKALDQLDVAAEVDNQLPLVKRRSWLLLAGAGILVVAFVVWAALTPSVTSTTAGGRVVAAPGALPVVSSTAGVVVAVSAVAGQPVTTGQPVATVRDGTGEQPVTSDVAGTAWQVLVVPGDAVPAGAALLTVLPPGSDASVLLAVPETSAAAIRPGMAVNVSGGGATTGRVTDVPAPLPADEAARRTGLALPAGSAYSLVTVALDQPLAAGAQVSGQVIVSESTVMNRLLGRG